MTGSQQSQNSGQPCSSGNGRPEPVRATWKLTPFASIVKMFHGFDLPGSALLEHARDDRDAAERYDCAPAQNDGTDKDDRALSNRA